MEYNGRQKAGERGARDTGRADVGKIDLRLTFWVLRPCILLNVFTINVLYAYLEPYGWEVLVGDALWRFLVYFILTGHLHF